MMLYAWFNVITALVPCELRVDCRAEKRSVENAYLRHDRARELHILSLKVEKRDSHAIGKMKNHVWVSIVLGIVELMWYCALCSGSFRRN